MDLALDVGCGKGEFAYLLAQKSKKVVGIDLSEETIKAETVMDYIVCAAAFPFNILGMLAIEGRLKPGKEERAAYTNGSVKLQGVIA